MAWNRNSGLALALIAIGGIILLNKFGFIFGPIMSYVIPVVLIALGYYGIKRGSTMGWIVATVGVLILLAKLSTIFIIITAVVLVGIGVTMLTGKGRSRV
ncbi:LiaF transmembrane domain-containing protein [Paenibacillus sp. KN14-4R]|uniref:LiaF transmembrane domain-containing protein n=1 Tax=Paenibacillus sp. KN14-4R TaxID=3445773 RepID=UPI003FA040EA